MKKTLKFVIVFLLGMILIPMVHAAELPKTGVTYFMTYPNGEVEVTEDYNVAINPPEKLLYTYETNVDGEVPLCDLREEGTLRIVQHVPTGYTTNQREITIDLSNTNGNVSFVDYKGGNPTTGRSILVILGVIAVVGATIIVSRKNKKALVIVPAILLVFVAYKAYAQECLCVHIKDGSGNPLSYVTVDVYGTPVVTAAPAIKLDANGGHFMNGKEIIYMALPSAECTIEELWDSLTNEEADYYLDNIEGAYRDGYYPEELIYPDEPLRNGSIARMDWSEDNDAGLQRIVGNGGTFNFHGEQLDELVLYDDEYPYDYMMQFVNGDNYYIGYDDNQYCSNYTSGGTWNGPTAARRQETYTYTYYLCWNAKPDGVYVNGILFRGNQDDCYDESDPYIGSDFIGLYNYDPMREYYIGFGVEESNDISIYYDYYEYGVVSDAHAGGDTIAREAISGPSGPNSRQINTIEIINNGQTVLSLTSNDLEKSDGLYYVANSTKQGTLYNFVSSTLTSCARETMDLLME